MKLLILLLVVQTIALATGRIVASRSRAGHDGIFSSRALALKPKQQEFCANKPCKSKDDSGCRKRARRRLLRCYDPTCKCKDKQKASGSRDSAEFKIAEKCDDRVRFESETDYEVMRSMDCDSEPFRLQDWKFCYLKLWEEEGRVWHVCCEACKDVKKNICSVAEEGIGAEERFATIFDCPEEQTSTTNSPCDENPCKNGGTCYSDMNDQGYTCACRDGWLNSNNCNIRRPRPECPQAKACIKNKGCGDPERNDDRVIKQCFDRCNDKCYPTIQISDPCDPNPCIHGKCKYITSQYTTTERRDPTDSSAGINCNCDDGWKGEYCSEKRNTTPSNKCKPNPCVHGKCILSSTSSTGFECTCEPGWKKTLCNVAIKPTKGTCDSNPCKHGGTCQQLTSDGYDCKCLPKWKGDNCDEYKP